MRQILNYLKRKLLVLTLLGLVIPCGWPLLVAAQVVDISACRVITDTLARFDCYESLAESGSLDKDPAPMQGNDMNPENAIQADEVPVNLGSRVDARIQTGPDPNSTEESGAVRKEEWQEQIADLKEVGPNLWLVTLANGQKWRQLVSKPYRIKVGDEVRIYSTIWGSSYRLSSPRLGSYIQVRKAD
jgi:hypothetical protein